MKYPIIEEIIGEPSLKLDGLNDEEKRQIYHVSSIIAKLTDIEIPKLLYFIDNFGFKNVLDNPSIMGVTEDQEALIKEIKKIVLFGVDEGGTNDNIKPVRY